MQVQRIQNNTNYNTSFNGKLVFYNYNKNRWFSKITTPKEDKILLDLFDSLHLKFIQSGCYDFLSKIESNDLLKYIELFPKRTKGINLPKPSKEEEESCYADVLYYKKPASLRSSYRITADGLFKIEHKYDKSEIKDVKD